MATKQTSSRTNTTTPAKKKPKSEAPPPATGVVSKLAPTHDDIAQRAFALYQSRGGQGGDPLHDWLAAERELSN